MHSLTKLFAIATTTVLVSVGATAQQSGPDDRYRIQLLLDGVPVQGSQELTQRLSGKSRAEQDAILNEPLVELTYGASAQLSVKVTDPNGVTRTFTKGSRVRFNHFGCLTISKDWFMTVMPSRACDAPEWPTLFVYFHDASGRPIAYSEFQFQLRKNQ